MHKALRYSFIFGLILFLTLLIRLDYRQLFDLLRQMNGWYLLIGFLLTAFELLFKAIKLQQVVSIFSKYSFNNALLTYLIGLPYGAVTPGKIGDVVKLYTLKQKTGLQRTECIAIGFIERLLELIALVVLATVGILALTGKLQKEQFIDLLIIIGIILLGFVLVLNRRIVKMFLRPFFYLLVPEHKRVQSRNFFNEFYQNVSKMLQNKGIMVFSLLLCILGWVTSSIRTYYFAQGLGITQLSFLLSIFVVPLIMLIELIPVSVLGIGTRDYGLVTLLILLGIPKIQVTETAVSLSFLMLVLGGIPPAILGYGVALKEHLNLKQIQAIQQENEQNDT
ncbi:MAG: lysylphosphatidylglycerol synthase transmembrane domain-containing protein [bacterium]|nr:lysylphosphatidylglycerol synthase transmembrane domain-containing protein [bacterium]